MLGAAVPATLLLARNDEVALALDELRAYPNGFTCTLVILRNPMAPRPPMEQHRPMPMHPMTARGPRLGFAFSDGSRARVDRPPFAPPPPGSGGAQSVAQLTARAEDRGHRPANPLGVPTDDDGIPLQPVLLPRGGGGSGDRFAMRFWCFPLPPPGPMTIHADWPDQGFEEVTVSFDADRIRAAADDAVTLWTSPDG